MGPGLTCWFLTAVLTALAEALLWSHQGGRGCGSTHSSQQQAHQQPPAKRVLDVLNAPMTSKGSTVAAVAAVSLMC
jgi:hypothetical protein